MKLFYKNASILKLYLWLQMTWYKYFPHFFWFYFNLLNYKKKQTLLLMLQYQQNLINYLSGF